MQNKNYKSHCTISYNLGIQGENSSISSLHTSIPINRFCNSISVAVCFFYCYIQLNYKISPLIFDMKFVKHDSKNY